MAAYESRESNGAGTARAPGRSKLSPKRRDRRLPSAEHVGRRKRRCRKARSASVALATQTAQISTRNTARRDASRGSARKPCPGSRTFAAPTPRFSSAITPLSGHDFSCISRLGPYQRSWLSGLKYFHAARGTLFFKDLSVLIPGRRSQFPPRGPSYTASRGVHTSVLGIRAPPLWLGRPACSRWTTTLVSRIQLSAHRLVMAYR